jgi:aspartate aminotransferase-like enzyme
MLDTMEAWVAAHPSVAMMAGPGERSPAISALRLPETRTPAAVMEALGERGFLVGGALDSRHGPILRIGHMGDLTPDHLAELLAAIEGILA